MTKLRIAISRVNGWQIRIVALSFLVLSIGSGSQFLVNAFAAGTESEAQNVQTINTVIDAPTSITTHTIHIKSRHAGVNSFGGYTVTRKK